MAILIKNCQLLTSGGSILTTNVGGGAAFTDSSDKRNSGTAGSGYQGVCFIRIPLE